MFDARHLLASGRSVPPLCLFSAALIPVLAVHAAEAETKLVSLDTVCGVAATYLRNVPRRLEVVRGEGNVTEGKGALLFGGRAPTGEGSKYFGILVPLAQPVDIRRCALTFDARTPTPNATRAFYVRFYNRGADKPAWSFASWNGQLKEGWGDFTVQRELCLDGLAWERRVLENRVADKIDRVEFIIGTRDNDVDVLAVVDNVRIVPRKPQIEDLTEPKELVRDTAVVVDGKPAAVVLHPDSDAGRAAAASVVAMAREKTGVTLPARVATEQNRRPDQTAFFLGNVHTNPAMLLLYARYMTPVDAVCPGKGGALVHTVFDPFGKGVNGVVVGASDADGLRRAVACLRRVVDAQPNGPDLRLPRIFERAYSADFLSQYGWADDEPAADRLERGLAEGQSALDRGRHTSVAGVLATVARRYLLTGHGVEAKLFAKLWDLYKKSAVADPRKFGGPWGFDSDFPSSTVVSGWRNIEYDPSLTDEERLATTQAMARWLAEAVVPSCIGAVASARVPHNHQTFPALGTLFAGLYFTEGFEVAEGQRWLKIADAIFKRQATYYKPWEDCNGYQWLTNGHLMRYTVARPDFALYENGNAHRIIDYCIGTMDNLGYQVPYGDTGSWKCWDTETVCLDTFAFVTGDAAAAWAGDRKHTLKDTIALCSFQRPHSTHGPPDKYDGVKVWPLEPQYYRSHRWADRPALERCFDKISFRSRMDPNAAYLLLDGLSNGGHKHLDGNSVPRLTLFGRIWLADNDYYKSAVKYHNAMMVFKDGQSAQIPAYVELLSAGETSRYGFSQTRIRGYAGADWERTILWLKGRQAFVVLDKLTALEASEYQFRLLWHGVGQATLGPHGLLLCQKGPSLWIQVAAGPEQRLFADKALGANWGGYPYAKPVVQSLSAIATVRLAKGESYLFASALHGAPDGRAEPWQLDYASRGQGVVVRSGDGPIVIGLPGFGMPTPHGSLTTDAGIVVADSDGLSLLHATHAQADSLVLLKSTEPGSVDIEKPKVRPSIAAIQTRRSVPNLKVEDQAPAHRCRWRKTLTPKVLTSTTTRGATSTGAKEKAKGAAVKVAPYRVNQLAVARLDGRKGPPVLLVATQQGPLLAMTGSGEIRWAIDLRCPLNDVVADDLDGDGTDEIVVGRQDHHVSVLDASGKVLWSRQLGFYRKPPYVNVVRTGDLNGDGRPEVVAGGENWRFYAFKGDGTELWNYESVHPSRSGAVADLDGDGKAEILCGTHYYYMSALNPDGTRRWRHNFGPICYDVVTGSFDGNKTRGVVCGGGDGYVHYLGHDGKPRMKYNTGDDVRCLATADLDRDGKDEIVAGSLNHNVYCFGSDGARRWRIDLGAPVSALATALSQQKLLVVAGTSSGKLVTLDPGGSVLASSQLAGEILELATLAGQIVVATSKGQLVALGVDDRRGQRRATSGEARGQTERPGGLIGYTEYRTNLPGGRHANVVTMRAYVARADGTGRRQLAADLTQRPNTWTQFSGFSPDGRMAIIGSGWEDPQNAAWEERHKTFRMTEGWRYDMALVDLQSGDVTNVTAIERVSDYNSGLFFWPRDPRKLGFQALIDGQSHPFSMDLDGRNKMDLTEDSKEFSYGFNASPDGNRIAYHKSYRVYLANADGTDATRVETGHPFNFCPQWSPDGRRVMFLSGEHYDCHPYLVRSDGTGLRKLADRRGYRGVVAFLDVYDFHGGSSDVPVWSTDSAGIYFSAKVGRSVELMYADLDGRVRQLTRCRNGTLTYHPKVHPKGRWIVFGSNRTGTRQLYVMPADGGDAYPITDVKPGWGAMWAHWQP